MLRGPVFALVSLTAAMPALAASALTRSERQSSISALRRGSDPTSTPMRLWWIPIPRIGVGYRFGNGLSAIRVVFGSPY